MVWCGVLHAVCLLALYGPWVEMVTLIHVYVHLTGYSCVSRLRGAGVVVTVQGAPQVCLVFSTTKLSLTTWLAPRVLDGCVDGCVKYSNNHVEDYRLSLTRWCSCDCPPVSSSHAKISWHDLQFFPRNVEMTEMDVEKCVSVLVLRIGCPSRLPRDTWRRSRDVRWKPRRWSSKWRCPGGGRDRLVVGLYNYCTEDDQKLEFDPRPRCRNHMRVSAAVLTRMPIRCPCSALPDDLHKILQLLLMYCTSSRSPSLTTQPPSSWNCPDLLSSSTRSDVR
jgi:hypothetical protein